MVDIILSAVQVVMKTPEEETLVREAEGRLKELGIWFDTGNTIEWPRIRDWCLDDSLECVESIDHENGRLRPAIENPMKMIVTELLGLRYTTEPWQWMLRRQEKLEQGIKDTIQTMRANTWSASLLRGFIADLEELLTNDS